MRFAATLLLLLPLLSCGESSASDKATSGSEGKEGWAHGTVNIREGHGTEHKVLTQLRYGDQVKVDSLQDGWYVAYKDGNRLGYVAASVIHDNAPMAVSRSEASSSSARRVPRDPR